MKQSILFLSFMLVLTSLKAQPISLPNGDFENWATTPYDEPNLPWHSSNINSISEYGLVSVKKIPSSSGLYAIRIENVASGNDTSTGFITNSLDDIENGVGGLPFTLKATKFNGSYRYNILPGDTAFIFVIFKKNAAIISNNLYKITGSQATGKSFSFNVAAMAQTPDSVIIAATSGNINSTPKLGSWIEFDDLAFEDPSLLLMAPGGDFENWTSKTYDEPADWLNQGFGEISKTTDKHTGSFAAKLISKDDGTGYVDEAELILGGQPLGMPFTKKTDTLYGYYKYTTSGTDTGLLTASFTDANGTPVAPSLNFEFLPVTNYTYFELPLSTTTTPSRLIVNIMSSDYNGNPVDGSTLFIDELKLKNTPTSIGDVTNQTKNFVVYPNPATNILHIKQINNTNDAADISIYNISGKLMHMQHFENTLNKTISIDIQKFAVGLYHYKITSGEETTTGKFIKE